MPTPRNPTPPGQRLLYWLAAAAREARTQAGVSEERIADRLNVRAVTITRFEKAAHWPSDVDRFMAGYAESAGIDDPRDIYHRALELWHQHGTAPHLRDNNGALTAGQQFEREISARRGRPRAPSEPEEKTSEARKRTAGP